MTDIATDYFLQDMPINVEDLEACVKFLDTIKDI